MSNKALKDFLKAELATDEVGAILATLLKGDDHPSVALRASALVELSLTESLLSRLWTKNGKANNELVEVGCPLGSFAWKIRMAEAMRVFGPVTRRDLDAIRTVRNAFAHSHRPLTFDHSSVAELCRNLTVTYWPGIPKTPVSERTPKDQFTFCSIGLFLILRERAIQTPRNIMPKRKPIYNVRRWWTDEYPEPLP
jgi:hypothetical protein